LNNKQAIITNQSDITFFNINTSEFSSEYGGFLVSFNSLRESNIDFADDFDDLMDEDEDGLDIAFETKTTAKLAFDEE